MHWEMKRTLWFRIMVENRFSRHPKQGVTIMRLQNAIGPIARLSMLLPLLFITSCGGGAKCTVTGRATYQGKPVYGGMVILIGETDQVAQGAIELDGTYTVNDA